MTRLCTSPNFALAHAADGSCYAAGEVEPYPQYWLDRREQLLFALFGKPGGLTPRAATEALVRLERPRDEAKERGRVAEAIAGMREAGVLIDPAGELSRYDRSMARDYLDHRPFPAGIAARIVELAGIGRETPVLDLAAGPGSLALELARASDRVRTIELSRGFVEASREEAAARGVRLDAIHESANRLPFHDGRYRAIAVSQALHWLDDVAVVKGVCNCLDAQGSFFVIHAALTLPDGHPLAWLLGSRTTLGDKTDAPFADEVRPLARRLALLFAALDTAAVVRHDPAHARRGVDPVGLAGITLFRQERPIGTGFARAFLSDSHIAGIGMSREDFWTRVEADVAAAPDRLGGVQEFALLHFRRGAGGYDADAWQAATMEPLGYP